MNNRKWSIIYFLLSVTHFVTFAYDIEHDKDFWTWMWLLSSITLFMVGFVMTISMRIESLYKQNKEIDKVCKALIKEYDDENVFMKTPIAYHCNFDKLKKLL